MASTIQIINSALARLAANPIISLTDGSKEQITAVNLFEISRKAVLRDHPWNFAIKEAEAPRLADQTPFDFTYAYQLPADCVRLLSVRDAGDYKVQGRKILTNADRCLITYVSDVQDTELFDPSFTDLMAQRLAADMAYPIVQSQVTADSMFTIYERKLQKARFVDASEDVQEPLGGHYSGFLGARY